jgi:mono/diheme cytochrome c family protein
MNKRSLLAIFVVLVAGTLLTNPAFSQMPGMDGMGMMRHSMVRHRYYMMNGIPPAYRNLENPISKTEKNIREGGKLYETNCASCHGAKGYGDGPAGRELNPQPSDIASTVQMPMMATDPYLYWTISDGGKELQTAMPPFKDKLSPDERWKVILYLREGLTAQ